MIRWAAGRPAVVWAAGAALTLAGGVAFTKLPLATKTQVELPRLTVSATWFGSAPELVLDMASVRGVGHRSRCGSWCRCRLSDERFEPKWRRMFHCQKADSS